MPRPGFGPAGAGLSALEVREAGWRLVGPRVACRSLVARTIICAAAAEAARRSGRTPNEPPSEDRVDVLWAGREAAATGSIPTVTDAKSQPRMISK